MVTTTEPGISSGEIYLITPSYLSECEEEVRELLLRHTESWVEVYTLDQIISLIYRSEMFVLVYVYKETKSLLLFKLIWRKTNQIIAVIELMSCQHFLSMASCYDRFENYLKALGVVSVEALAHPTIAKYMIQRNGFRSPGLVIRKQLLGHGEH